MDNSETLTASLGTQDTGRRQTKQTNTTQKTRKDEQQGHQLTLGVNQNARKLLAVPTSCNTPVMKLI